MFNVQDIEQGKKSILEVIIAGPSYFAHHMFTTRDKIFDIIQITFSGISSFTVWKNIFSVIESLFLMSCLALKRNKFYR